MGAITDQLILTESRKERRKKKKRKKNWPHSALRTFCRYRAQGDVTAQLLKLHGS